ncbi:glucose 1-dehydrogenase [Colwellia sp. 1_MG-2023]|uniref:glucose 1-dehydrogenase n=1 Tax=unclassified Colwellia TaxID=196834 RepID=UPI001C09686A|nr:MULTISPECIES: glucose 1-dehydrogenase [unclassified Colwellia]MBU2924842.1 glucose 1-dehydrogenase [Colwellia sp. C2M11]MDO6654076.1 glucose 1-dehydrogenase [Colwellia sp. 3_MG-2023]MDO6665494.1 glucose 1-dehydrogenase [Colwellia sp. 2_MG-2023]MDO6689747.1 glucose 1-dehydrogenase [Colwellia sp. 1_MG-2023]
MNPRLNKKVVIVTGAADGIGQAIAELFCQEGALVCVADVNEALGVKVAAELVAKGGKAIFVKTDVANIESVQNMVKITVETLGKPNILINNAGIIYQNNSPLNTTQAQWDKSFNVNLDGMWHCCKEVLPFMQAAGEGSIVNIGSVHSFKIVPNHFPYAVTKHAIIGLTKNLAVEFGEHNIRVNALCPGMVETPAAFRWFEESGDPVAARKALGDIHPLRRNAACKEIAYPALFLASDESSFMTGQSMIVDGGRSVVYHL